jgi:O-antigen/teichoic acid export membrane protein
VSQQTRNKAQVIADEPRRLEIGAAHTEADAPPPPPAASVYAPRRAFSAHVAWTLTARLLMVANSMAASIIVARWLGASGFGALAVLNVATAIALQLGSAGLPSANTYFIARDHRLLGTAWANALIFALGAGSALTLCIVGLAHLRPSLFGHVPLALLGLAALSIPFQLVTLLGLNIFLGLGRIGRFNLLEGLAQSFTLVNSVAALVVLGAGLWVLVSLNTAACALVSLLIARMIFRLVARQGGSPGVRPDLQLFKRMARYSIKFHVSVVAAMLLIRADLLVVNYFRGAMEAGVYALASQVAMMLMLLPGVVGTLLMPRVTSARDVSGQLTMRATRHTAFVMLVICLVVAPASLLLPLLYGAQFADASLQFLILLPGVYLISIESVLVQHFNSTGLPLAIPLFWLATLATNVVLNLALVPGFGALAAAAAATFSYAMIFALVVLYFRLKTGNPLSATLLVSSRELRELLRLTRFNASAG